MSLKVKPVLLWAQEGHHITGVCTIRDKIIKFNKMLWGFLCASLLVVHKLTTGSYCSSL